MENLEFKFPITRTHCGMVMGNGNLGAMIWGKDKLHVTVNRADFWSHCDSERIKEGVTYKKIQEAYYSHDPDKIKDVYKRDPDITERYVRNSRVPLGRFEFEMKSGCKLESCILDYPSGTVTVKVAGPDKSHELKLNLLLDRNLLAIEDAGGVISTTLCRPSWEWVGELLGANGYSAPELVEQENLKGWIQSTPDDSSLAAACRKSATTLLISLELGDDNAKALECGKEQIEKSLAEGLESQISKTHDWWKKYWQETPKVTLPDEFLNKFINYGLYKFAGATHPFSPIPCGLQGPWVEEYQRAQWAADYHFNVNIQQIYTLGFPANRNEHLLPLFDMLESAPYQEVMQANAKHLFGIDDGLLITHAVDDKGHQCGGLSPGATLDQACTGWCAQLYWLYYQHTLDKEFLRNRAYPFMLGTMRTYEAMLEEYEGRLSIPMSISAEFSFKIDTPKGPFQVNFGRDPSYQLACMHMLLDALRESCEILGIEPRPVWQEIKKRVPPYTLYDKDDEPRIAIWEDQDLDFCHRHHSHLGCIYPFDSLGDWEPHQEIIDNSVDQWILRGMGQWSEWCIPWAAIIHARLGFTESPRILLNMWREIFINEGLTTAYLPRFQGITAHRRADMLKPKETNEVMQLDGTMGGITAIYEMLVHAKCKTIHVFPAVSEKWQDVSFDNIGVPGAFQISGIRKNGQTTEVKITSRKGGSIKLQVNGRESMVLWRGDKQETVSFPAEIPMQPGETVVLS